ncbi:Protein ImuA' [Pontimonas salivibrio]|uniref:Protein ImuA n=1 Tax=Pontimonas salivibrio TaxID=1159327 RepID=A0A2L2BQP6_9MICO|nr:hypothetical protein [Pontimonas salivibrio]AVG23993.1 Protein ImuA' [Pontimonas salivibrio]
MDIDIIEQMFEHGSVSPLTLHPTARIRREQVEALRQHIRHMESPPVDQPVFPSAVGVDKLFPDGGLRRGVVYEISEGRSLLWSLLAGPSQAGHWIALVGMAHLGLQAAADAGVNLERLVLVPQPGSSGFSVMSTLADALPLVVLSPSGALPPQSQRDRFQARLRERGATLLIRATWPGSEGRISVTQRSWEGLGHGFGLLSQQHITLSHQHRRETRPRYIDLCISSRGIESQHRATIRQIGTGVEPHRSSAAQHEPLLDHAVSVVEKAAG